VWAVCGASLTGNVMVVLQCRGSRSKCGFRTPVVTGDDASPEERVCGGCLRAGTIRKCRVTIRGWRQVIPGYGASRKTLPCRPAMPGQVPRPRHHKSALLLSLPGRAMPRGPSRHRRKDGQGFARDATPQHRFAVVRQGIEFGDANESGRSALVITSIKRECPWSVSSRAVGA
jgi:hypothetical protein